MDQHEALRILGLADATSRSRIKAAYLRQMHKMHPDKHPNATEETRKSLVLTAQRLSDARNLLLRGKNTDGSDAQTAGEPPKSNESAKKPSSNEHGDPNGESGKGQPRPNDAANSGQPAPSSASPDKIRRTGGCMSLLFLILLAVVTMRACQDESVHRNDGSTWPRSALTKYEIDSETHFESASPIDGSTWWNSDGRVEFVVNGARFASVAASCNYETGADREEIDCEGEAEVLLADGDTLVARFHDEDKFAGTSWEIMRIKYPATWDLSTYGIRRKK